MGKINILEIVEEEKPLISITESPEAYYVVLQKSAAKRLEIAIGALLQSGGPVESLRRGRDKSIIIDFME